MTEPSEGSFQDVETGRMLAGTAACPWIGVPDPSSRYLVGPALFDPQVNGFAGVDFQDPNLTIEALEHAVQGIRKSGCSHILLTLLTQSPDYLEDRFATLSSWIDRNPLLQETILGFHLEGPFLSPQTGYPGAHSAEFLCDPDPALVERWAKASKGRLNLLTLAPELPGATELIGKLRARGIWVSLGHTDASFSQCLEAVRAGATMATHLGNGCPEQLHRHDNIIERLLALPEVLISIIPDGIHVPFPALANLIRAVGPARLVFTTDAISAAGAPIGTYRIGSLEVEVGIDGVVRHPSGKSFAGSSLRMIDGLLNCVRLGGVGFGPAWKGWTRLRDRMFPHITAPSLAVPILENLEFQPDIR